MSCNPEFIALNFMNGNLNHFQHLLQIDSTNVGKYRQYNDSFISLQQLHSNNDGYLKLGLKPEKYRETENILLNEIKIPGPMRPYLNLVIRYRSPQGRTNLWKKFTFSAEDMAKVLTKKDDYSTFQESKTYERSLMTDKLRYAILKRDNFRCQICGATQADGVKLHVDHIVPVSKGGKTQWSNLRTLCDRCNLGKGARYDPDGLN